MTLLAPSVAVCIVALCWLALRIVQRRMDAAEAMAQRSHEKDAHVETLARIEAEHEKMKDRIDTVNARLNAANKGRR